MTWIELAEKEIKKHAKTDIMYKQRLEYVINSIKRGKLIKKIIERYKSLDNKKILDIGSGEGGISIAFGKDNKSHVCALDIDPDWIKRAKIRSVEERVNINLIYGDGLNLPIRKKSFNIIICSDVIEHVNKPEKLVENI